LSQRPKPNCGIGHVIPDQQSCSIQKSFFGAVLGEHLLGRRTDLTFVRRATVAR
jgi:hypothetical protein